MQQVRISETLSEHQASVILNLHSKLGEGALWDSKGKVLLWVDIKGHLVHVYEPEKDVCVYTVHIVFSFL